MPDFRKDLDTLLRSFFSASELRRFLRDLPEGAALIGDLPGEPAPLSELSSKATELLIRDGQIDDDFFAALRVARPRRAGEVEVLNGVWRVEIRVSPPKEPPNLGPQRQPPPRPSAWWRFPEAEGLLRVEIDLAPGAAETEAPLAPGLEVNLQLRCRELDINRPGSFRMPWSEDTLLDLRARLGSPGPGEKDGAFVVQWGNQLRAALQGLDGLMFGLASNPSRPIELAMRSMQRRLLLLPWEILPLRSNAGGQALVLEPGCTLVRRLPIEGKVRRQGSAGEGGCLLFAWSNGGGSVPHDEHKVVLESWCKSQKIQLVEVPEATALDLMRRGRELTAAGTPARVLHLLCHGRAISADANGLSLGSGDRPVLATPSQVRTLFQNSLGQVELATVFACDAASGGAAANVLGSVADAAWYAGVDVIAPQIPLTIAGSNLAVDTFYEALLAKKVSLSQALQQTVEALQLGSSETYDWASLVRMRPEAP